MGQDPVVRRSIGTRCLSAPLRPLVRHTLAIGMAPSARFGGRLLECL